MNITFREGKTLDIETKDKLKQFIDIFCDKILELVPSLEPKHLSIVN